MGWKVIGQLFWRFGWRMGVGVVMGAVLAGRGGFWGFGGGGGGGMGAVLGGSVAFGVLGRGRYVGVVPFTVLPPWAPISVMDGPTGYTPLHDDTSDIIIGQSSLFQQDAFLQEVAGAAEFRPG